MDAVAAVLEDLFGDLLLPQFWKQEGQPQFLIKFQKNHVFIPFKGEMKISAILLQWWGLIDNNLLDSVFNLSHSLFLKKKPFPEELQKLKEAA